MCGIFAAVNTNGLFQTRLKKEYINSTEIIAYRGPDYQGIRTVNTIDSSSTEEQFNVFLGHRRLSIIDLSEGGVQPMERDGCIIIYNGEIFNYIELRKELQHAGYHFTGESDTEVIIRTYQAWGQKGFARLNGMWAFILIDLKKNLAICSRDRFSVKPLYYHHDGDSWFFASEIKQLLPYLRIRKLNDNLAYQFLRQQLLEHTDDTFYDGIKKIPAKSNLVLDLRSKEYYIEKYWDFNPEKPPDSENEIIDRFHELLDDSIRIRMRSDVKIGALLSGGLDSSSITVLADKYSDGTFSSFSVVSADSKYSEEKFIDQLVHHHPHQNHKLQFKSDVITEVIGQVLYHQDQPFVSLSIVAQYLIFKQIKNEHDIKVILSGQGGDEVMLGYLKYYFFNLMECQRKHQYFPIIRELFGSFINRTVLWQLEWNEMKRYLPMFAGKPVEFLKLNGTPEPVWQFNSVLDRQRKDIDLYSIPALAHFEDRNSMASSIESRLPFLDHRLVNFLLGLPVGMKMKNGWTKYILRKSVTELPNSIRWRRDKQAFNTPEVLWLKNQLVPMIESEFKNSSLHEAGIISKKDFMNYYGDFLKGKTGMDPTLIFRTFIFEKWFKNQFG
jgi:asparagine synthase (glutamine-hydrolysing)